MIEKGSVGWRYRISQGISSHMLIKHYAFKVKQSALENRPSHDFVAWPSATTLFCTEQPASTGFLHCPTFETTSCFWNCCQDGIPHHVLAKLEVEIPKQWRLGPGTFGTFGAIRLMELSESALALKHWSSASCGLWNVETCCSVATARYSVETMSCSV